MRSSIYGADSIEINSLRENGSLPKRKKIVPFHQPQKNILKINPLKQKFSKAQYDKHFNNYFGF